jgi:hypothetical protein
VSADGISAAEAASLLHDLIGDVTAADGCRYGATDDAGHVMHCAKVVEDAHAPAGAPRYLAVYHSVLQDGRFHASLAASSDLLSWSVVRTFGRGSSQPTIFVVPSGGYVLAWEKDPRNHIVVRYYATRSALFEGRATRRYSARRSLSRCAEGTPNVYAVELGDSLRSSVIRLGGHYWWDCDVDRQMQAALTGFRRWSASAVPSRDAAVLSWGVAGNIGGRDAFTFLGHRFEVVEGQYVKDDFGSWRTFLYDPACASAAQVEVRTAGGSTAFANPHVTALTGPSGRRALAVSLFVPFEGAAAGEGGGLMYWREY